MIIKYLNEGAFGSYKNKTTKEDRLKNLKDETKRIMDRAFRDLDFEIKKAIYDTICAGEGEGIVNDVKAFCQIWDETYDFVENSKDQKLECNFITEYKVNEDKDAVAIYTRIPVYATTFTSSVPGAARDCIFIDDMITDYDDKKINLKSLLVKAEESMYFYYHELNEKICDWFSVNHVYWYYRFHLVSRREPLKLFNDTIFYRNIAIFESTLNDFIHDVTEAFDWFSLKCNVFRCNNISANCNNDKNCRILGEISKWIKTNELQLVFKANKNNVESLGDYHRLFLTKEENSNIEAVIPYSIYGKPEQGVVDLYCDPLFAMNHGTPVLKYRVNDSIFSDKLLNTLFGYDNESILNISVTEITDEPSWVCTQIIYNINNIKDTLKVFCAKCK